MADKPATIQDYLYVEGLYDPSLRFAFKNILNEPFESKWANRPYTVKPGDTVKIQHHLAVKFTKEIVDKMMQADNKGMMIAVPAARKPYEDRVLQILPSENGNELEIIKAEFFENLQRDINRPEGEPDQQSPAENVKLDFEDLSKHVEISAPTTEPVELKKGPGRPRKASVN